MKVIAFLAEDMRKFIALLLPLISLSWLACERREERTYESTPKTLDIGTDKAILYKNIRYGDIPKGVPTSDPSSDRLLDIYVPTAGAPEGGYPVFLFIHGGGFSAGDKGGTIGYDNLCKEMSIRGYAAISMNYHLTMKYNKVLGVSCSSEMKNGLPASGDFHPLIRRAITEASNDAILVLGWIKKNNAKYKLNADEVTICGGSAGAITSLHVAYLSGQKVIKLRSVINLWGAVADPDKISGDVCPILTYHGDQDALINVVYGEALHNRISSLDPTRSVFNTMAGKGHAQYNYIIQNKMEEIDSFIKSHDN